ncbi:Alpha/Beta hydrolase protein [Immersiella caudata]|uniref:Alpha/Beta hydrolase protein n=1 Tax=Immersiella caudata TaxID=314043 RepID=A0AA40BTS9_9PEZI|nr:Alpha/Beta hydrolase protein [Immersiella caudata]
MSDNASRTGTDPVNAFIRADNSGIRKLQNVIRELREEFPGGLQQKTPIVLVPGFAGWGKPFLGAVNYFGGFSDLAAVLEAQGYIVISARLSPLSSNKERACELFQQLSNIEINAAGKGSGFEKAGDPAVPVPVSVDYGNLPLNSLQPKLAPETWPAVVHGSDRFPKPWKWSKTNRLTFICHSQGGTTVRLLLHYLSGGAPDDLPQFPTDDHRARAKAVITLGTPHKGTTVTDLAHFLLKDDVTKSAIVDLVTSCSFASRTSRIYDLGLDHWGFTRSGQETYLQMRERIGPAVLSWWNGTVNGLYDNSLPGVSALDILTASSSLNQSPTYFFTMAFCATVPFPKRTLTHQDVQEFFDLFPAGKLAGLLGIPHFAVKVLNVANWVSISPPIVKVLGWVTHVARRHLKEMHYFSQIPVPGEQIPRADMLLVLAPFAYGMGGLAGNDNKEWGRNDGIVNTVSMDGPDGWVKGATGFVDEVRMGRGKGGWWWYFGENNTVDHADQIGVFTDPVTNEEVEVMYKLFAELADQIP